MKYFLRTPGESNFTGPLGEIREQLSKGNLGRDVEALEAVGQTSNQLEHATGWVHLSDLFDGAAVPAVPSRPQAPKPERPALSNQPWASLAGVLRRSIRQPPRQADPVQRAPEHGTVQVSVPWTEKLGRFTRLFERLAVDLMLECSISAACEILRISWEADGIKQRSVLRGLSRKKAQIDKKSFLTRYRDRLTNAIGPCIVTKGPCGVMLSKSL